MKQISPILLSLGLALLGCCDNAFAARAGQKLCMSGQQIIVRKNCRKNEVTLNSVSSTTIKPPVKKGPQGPAGSKGRSGVDGKPGQAGPTGPQGNSGFSGVKGNTGPVGRPGRSTYDALESGNGAFGVVGGDFGTPDGVGTDCVRIPFRSPLGSDNYKRVVVLTQAVFDYCGNNFNRFTSCCNFNRPSDCFPNVTTSTDCPGTAVNPKALNGTLCVYPTEVINAVDPRVVFASRSEFQLCWNKDGLEGEQGVIASWAIAAP